MNCPICSAGAVKRYFEVRSSPVLQNVWCDSAELARNAPTVDADFWVCEQCQCLFNPFFKPVDYPQDYNNDQSYSAAYRNHLDQVCALLQTYVARDSRIVEIGCGNGMLLSLLAEAGYEQLTGFDPAHSGGLPFVKREYWGPTQRTCRALVLRHALEAMVSFRETLAAATGEIDPDGILYLELTNSRVIVERAATVTLYPEYPQYFSEAAISLLLAELGFYVHEIRHFLGGEILGVVGRRRRVRMPRSANLQKLDPFRKVYIWGISGRTVHFLTHHGLGTEIISWGVDVDPKKQGRFVPRTAQRIVSPEECIAGHPDAVVVLNPRYVEEVRALFPYPVVILTDKDFYDE